MAKIQQTTPIERQLYKREYDASLNKLRQELGGDSYKRNTPVVLFLGTGINGSALRWTETILPVLKQAVREYCLKNNIEDFSEDLAEDLQNDKNVFSEILQASIIKEVLGNRYVPALKESIYGILDKNKIYQEFDVIEKGLQLNPQELPQNKLSSLFAIAYAIVRGTMNVVAVVTQSYDKFLTYAVDYLQHEVSDESEKVRCVDIYGNDYNDPTFGLWGHLPGYARTQSQGCKIPVYHVHGYISPFDEMQAENDRGNQVIMSMDEFQAFSRNAFSWQTATQIHFLSHYTCIFAGLSLNDYTSQRLLCYIKDSGNRERNIYYLNSYHENDVKAARLAFLKRSYYKDMGMEPILSPKGFEQLYYDVFLKNN